MESGIPLLLRELRGLSQDENIAIAFPDDGAHKRFHLMFEEWPTIICFKIRDGAKRIVKVKEGMLCNLRMNDHGLFRQNLCDGFS